MNNGEPWNNLLACSRVFVEVQAMEPLLRGGHCMTITRSGDHVVSVKVYAAGDSRALHRYKVRAKDVTNEQELQREMDALWRELVTKRLIDLDALGKGGHQWLREKRVLLPGGIFARTARLF